MNLIVWKSPVVEEPEEARMLVERYFATGSRDVFDPSDDAGAPTRVCLEECR